MRTQRPVFRLLLLATTAVAAGCAENDDSPAAVRDVSLALQEQLAETAEAFEQTDTRPSLHPDIDRLPVGIDLIESHVLSKTRYRPNASELARIEARLLRVLNRAEGGEVADTDVLYSSSLSAFQRIPYLSREVTESPPKQAKPFFKACYLHGNLRSVFKVEAGHERIHRRVYYDDGGAPAVVSEYQFTSASPSAVHYLQYDDRGYLARCLEFWAKEDGLRHRATYLVLADRDYDQATVYWFTETGEFREKHSHESLTVHEQTYRDDQPRQVGYSPFRVAVDYPRQYGMQSLLPPPAR